MRIQRVDLPGTKGWAQGRAQGRRFFDDRGDWRLARIKYVIFRSRTSTGSPNDDRSLAGDNYFGRSSK